jgi:hypothetical protein
MLTVQRERRREFIVKYGLLNVRRVHGQERKRLPAEKEQYTKLRVFARWVMCCFFAKGGDVLCLCSMGDVLLTGALCIDVQGGLATLWML